MRTRRSGVVLAGIVALAASPVSAHAGPVPYSDPGAVGTITLCDTAGNPLTHGDTRIKPFVWRAVGSAAAPKGYTGAGRSAGLYGYQPLRGVDPSQWNGEYLTAGSRYSDANRPMAAATAVDPTLADYLGDYPASWDGLVQLRLFVAAPQQPALTAPYNAATIRVSGTSWTLVDGGRDGCGSGIASSSEQILPRVRKLATPAPNATTDVPPSPGARAGSSGASRIPGAASAGSSASGPTTGAVDGSAASPGTSGPAAGGASVSAVAASSSHDSGSSAGPWIAVAAVIGFGAGGGLLWWRRRSDPLARATR